MATNRARSAAHAINKTKMFVESSAFAEISFLAAKLRYETLESDWIKFHTLADDSLDVIGKRDLPKLMDEIEEVRADYFIANTALQEKLAALSREVQNSEDAGSNNYRTQLQVDMPFEQHDLQNTWGEFDGTYTEWIGFHDRFKAAIHNNKKISPGLKFSYLKKSLVGRAAGVLSEWQLNDEDYNEAWERLNQTFDKKYMIGRDLLQQLLDLPVLREQPTADELQRMANTTIEKLWQLKLLCLPVEHWDFVVIHILNGKFDPETACQWELQRDSEQPTLSSMLAFIERQVAALSNVSGNQQAHLDFKGHAYSNRSDPQVEQQEVRPPRGQRRKEDKLCEVCSAPHQIWECPDFKALSFHQRKDFVDGRPICPNCLKHGHKDNTCYQRGCARCPGAPKHNIFLCPSKKINQSAFSAVQITDRPTTYGSSYRRRGSKRNLD